MDRNPAIALLLALALPAAAATPEIRPAPGVVFTTVDHYSVVTTNCTFPLLDSENLISIKNAGPEAISYSIRMTAPANATAEEELRKAQIKRTVRREDLGSATRIAWLNASTDPEVYAGQTFIETSTKVLESLKTTGESPLVVGAYVSADFGALLAAQTKALCDKRTAQKEPGLLGFSVTALLQQAFNGARHYYRGTVKRVESTPVAVPVLVDGVRTSLPAIHAAGTLAFGSSDTVKVDFWWLDDPAYPLALRASLGDSTQVITRIDLPVRSAGGGGGGAGGGGGGGSAAMTSELDSKHCRVELHGIYFNSGSATLLPESAPMLTTVAELINRSKDSMLTIEGHTDNIGSAAYNQDLSERRASAVRQALVSQYGVAPGRLTSKGFGFTRPVETNDTIEGRAHNRRVELSRPCAASK